MTEAQNELPEFTLIFLIFFYDLALCTYYSIFIPVGHRNFFPRLFRCTSERIASNAIISFAYSDTPTPLTASAQSVTFGSKSSNFKLQSSIAKRSFVDSICSVSDLRFKKFNVQTSMFKVQSLIVKRQLSLCSLQILRSINSNSLDISESHLYLKAIL